MIEAPKAGAGDTPAAGGAEEAMHFHRPKALHGPRELAIEIAIIVVGIVIALVGEQAVEALHWRHKVEETEQSVRLELSRDDGPQAFARAAITRCNDDQLGAIITAVEAGRDRSQIARLSDAYSPPLRTWDHQSWDAAVGSDIGSHIGAARLNSWARVFDLMPVLNAQTAKEADGIDLLTGGSAAKGALSAEQADRVLRAAKSLRRVNFEMDGFSVLLLRWLDPLGAEPTETARAAILADARRRYGACVVVPDYRRAAPEPSQYNVPGGAPGRR